MPYRVTFLVMIASLAFGCESAADKRAAHLEQELMQVRGMFTETMLKLMAKKLV